MARSLLCSLILLAAAPAWGWKLSSSVEAEARYFYQAEGETFSPSLAGRAELFHDWADGKERFVAEVFARVDEQDRSRTHADAREFYIQGIGETLEMKLGLSRVFWGVTESRHLVDVINQSDFVEDLEAENKLGQPMFNVTHIGGYGTVDFFLLPYQRARTFPGPQGHPRVPFPFAPEEARYESPRGQHHLDTALRYRNSFGPLDLGLAWFDGTAREPRILPCLRRGSGFAGTETQANCDILSGIVIPESPFPPPVTALLQALGLAPSNEDVEAEITAEVLRNIVLVPAYDRLRQISLDAQYVHESWALKLETLLREQGGESTWAATGGFEYTLPDWFETGWDISALAEYNYDERADFLTTRYDNDAFVGTRFGFNDEAGTQILAGGLVDRSGKDQLWQIEASRRFGDAWLGSLKLRVFEQVPQEGFTGFLEREDMLSLKLERFF